MRLVVINDLDSNRPVVGPNEADPVPLVDPNTMLSGPIPCERLEPIAGWHMQVGEPRCRVKLLKLPGCYPPKLSWTRAPRGLGIASVEDVLGSGSSKRANHLSMIARIPCYVQTSKSGSMPETVGCIPMMLIKALPGS